MKRPEDDDQTEPREVTDVLVKIDTSAMEASADHDDPPTIDAPTNRVARGLPADSEPETARPALGVRLSPAAQAALLVAGVPTLRDGDLEETTDPMLTASVRSDPVAPSAPTRPRPRVATKLGIAPPPEPVASSGIPTPRGPYGADRVSAVPSTTVPPTIPDEPAASVRDSEIERDEPEESTEVDHKLVNSDKLQRVLSAPPVVIQEMPPKVPSVALMDEHELTNDPADAEPPTSEMKRPVDAVAVAAPAKAKRPSKHRGVLVALALVALSALVVVLFFREPAPSPPRLTLPSAPVSAPAPAVSSALAEEPPAETRSGPHATKSRATAPAPRATPAQRTAPPPRPKPPPAPAPTIRREPPPAPAPTPTPIPPPAKAFEPTEIWISRGGVGPARPAPCPSAS